MMRGLSGERGVFIYGMKEVFFLCLMICLILKNVVKEENGI